MTELFSLLLESYGSAVTLTRDGRSESLRAFLQPVRSAGAHRRSWTGLGSVEPGQAVYIGPAGTEIAGGTLRGAGRRWRVQRSELISLGDEAVYRWGVLLPIGEEESDAGDP